MSTGVAWKKRSCRPWSSRFCSFWSLVLASCLGRSRRSTLGLKPLNGRLLILMMSCWSSVGSASGGGSNPGGGAIVCFPLMRLGFSLCFESGVNVPNMLSMNVVSSSSENGLS